MIYQFRIQIKDIKKPPVWRRLSVPSTFTFERFHEVIQLSFGWYNCHLFRFESKSTNRSPVISIPSEDDWEPVIDAGKVKLKDIFNAEGQTFMYIYDFGDNWEHEIKLESITPENSLKATCLAGKGSCPPEDCGGARRYEKIKTLLKESPNSPEAAHFRDWLELDPGETWEELWPFDIDEVNEELRLL